MISWQPPMIRVARHRFRTSCPQESSISPASQIIRPCVLTDSLTRVEQPCGAPPRLSSLISCSKRSWRFRITPPSPMTARGDGNSYRANNDIGVPSFILPGAPKNKAFLRYALSRRFCVRPMSVKRFSAWRPFQPHRAIRKPGGSSARSAANPEGLVGPRR